MGGGCYHFWQYQRVPKSGFSDGFEVLGKISAIDVAHEVPSGHLLWQFWHQHAVDILEHFLRRGCALSEMVWPG